MISVSLTTIRPLSAVLTIPSGPLYVFDYPIRATLVRFVVPTSNGLGFEVQENGLIWTQEDGTPGTQEG